MIVLPSSGASAISEGDLFIYSCSAQLISFEIESTSREINCAEHNSAQLISFEIESTSREINCAEHEYMNMSPSLIALAPLLVLPI